MEHARLVVFSDLDGTLLDHTTYEFGPARPALDRLRAERVPLVLCTSKTRSEVEPLREILANNHPFIVENGGGIYIPTGYFPFVVDGAERRGAYSAIPIGDRYDDLVAVLATASRRSGVAVRGFADMTDADVAAATGLSLADARRARDRDFDEPFEVLQVDRMNDLLAAIEREGKRWTRGGRFHHITGASDKAVAVRRLIALFRRHLGTVRTVGLGDAPNDSGLLNSVDVPILIASEQVDTVRALVPRGRVTTRSGPSGWNEAVLAVLDGH